MPNASKKKHRKDATHKVQNITEYAKGFMLSVGSKELAMIKCDLLSRAALNGPLPDATTANFWNNVKGHLKSL